MSSTNDPLHFLWLLHALIIDSVRGLAFLGVVYPLICLGFRVTVLEHITADEYTQGIASVALSLAILLDEFQGFTTNGEVSPRDVRDLVKAVVILACLVWTYRAQISGPKYSVANSVDVRDKVYIVTGGNSGIGSEVVRELARRGAKVILGCRDTAKGEQVQQVVVRQTGNPNVFVEQIDLESFDSVKRFVERTRERFPVIDCLVNNAGTMLVSRQVTQDGHESMLQTNFLSTFLLTVLLIPRLKKSSLSRICNVSSSTSRVPKGIAFHDMEAESYYFMLYTYGHSKYCQNQISFELARRLVSTGITVNTCHPGCVLSNVTRSLPWIIQQGHLLLYLINKSTREGAQTLLHLATSFKLKSTTGLFFEHCEPCSVPRADATHTLKLFEYAEQTCGVSLREYLDK